LPKKSPAVSRLRLPPPAEGVDVNFCRNPYCANFGQPERHDLVVKKGRPRKGEQPSEDQQPRYKVAAVGRLSPAIFCPICEQSTRVKSNLGVHEERSRLIGYLRPEHGPACPNQGCVNHGRGVLVYPQGYKKNGTSAHGSQRFMCKACGRTASLARSAIARQKRSHVNRLVMELLMNGMAMRRVAKVARIDPKTLYDKIGFLHQQCLRFVRHREWRLHEMELPPLYLCSDKQDYYTNWTDSARRENARLTAVGTADLDTGYVFAMSLNYVEDLNVADIEAETRHRGEYEWAAPYRRYGHYWLPGDVEGAKGRPVAPVEGQTVEDRAAAAAEDAEYREREEFVEDHRGLPSKGVQVRQEYTAYGQYHVLAGLLHNSPHITLYLDQDSDLRSAALATFQARIRLRMTDVFFVKTEKTFTNEEKSRLAKRGHRHLAQLRELYPELTDEEIRRLVMRRRIERRVGTVVHPYNDLWIRYPFPRKSEPEKAVSCLTDFEGEDLDARADLYLRASLHAIDRFFMQLRRAVSLVERPISSSANASRIWQGKNAYNPAVIQKLIEIYRVMFNYVEVGEDRQTPAMRLGLAQAPLDPEDIIYFMGC